MPLTQNLIEQFVKITNDKKQEKQPTSAYGTIKRVGMQTFIQLDGSDILTPFETTTRVNDGERVTVTIKNHMLTVTGNLTAPSANSDDLENIIDVSGDISDVIAQLIDIVRDLEANKLDKDQFGGRVLWEGNDLMGRDSEIQLSENISDQLSGVMLVFGVYTEDGRNVPTAYGTNDSFIFATADGLALGTFENEFQFNSTHMIPKALLEGHYGDGHIFRLSDAFLNRFASKYLNIFNNKITGHLINTESGVGESGIKFNNQSYSLKYVIGV